MRLLLILLCSSLVGCSMFGDRVVVKTELTYVPIVCPDPPGVQPIKARQVRPKAIQDASGITWIGLRATDYENLTINTRETIRYIRETRGVVRYYRQCIIDFNRDLAGHHPE